MGLAGSVLNQRPVSSDHAGYGSALDSPGPANRRLENGPGNRGRIDLAGIIGFSGTMIALLVFLMALPTPNWIALSLAILIGMALVWWELRASHPFIDIRLLAANRGLTLTYLRFALGTLCVYTVLYGVTQWIEVARGISPETAGLLLLPMSLVGSVLALPISRLNLVRAPLIAAAFSCLIASAGVLLIGTTTPIVWVVVITLIFGVTLGTSVSANQTTMYTEVSADQIGTASGLCAPSVTSARSPHRPSFPSSSTRASAITVYTP